MVGIYLIQNKINGHCYIGQSMDIARRWRSHRNAMENKENTPLYCAMRKYGVENFAFSILEECLIEELDEKEIYYIEKYNSYFNGYNQTRGGAQYQHNVKISDEDYEEIVDFLMNSSLSQKDIAKKFQVGEDTISEINTGKSRRCDDFIYPLRKNHKKYYCIDCGIEVCVGAQRCKICHQKSLQRVERPSKEQLYEEVKLLGFSAVGRKYGVTDNAIRKWCKTYGLPIRASEYKGG